MKTATIAGAMLRAGLVLGLAGVVPAALADDAQRLADINAAFTAGKYDEAVAEAKALLGATQDKDATIEARRVLAECYRKQGDWRAASGAYTALGRACPHGSEEKARYEAIGEVLRATNAKGVYGSAVSGGEKRPLSDDEALDDALAMWVEFQIKQFSNAASRVARVRNPADVLKIVKPLGEEARAVLSVAPDTARGKAARKQIQEETRKVALAASERLAQLCKAARSILEKKLHKYQPKMQKPWAFTNIEERDIAQTNKLCNQMAAAEAVFMESVADLAGPDEWSQAESIRAACTDRQATYRDLAKEFVVPEYTVEFIW